VPEFEIRWSEWRFVGLVVGIVLVLTSWPYAFAALTAPADKHFMGFILNASDHAQYLAWYKGFQTAFLISNRLTPEPNPAVFFNLLWFILGRLGRYTGWSYIAVYQLFRWVAGASSLVMVYAFSALFFQSVRHRRTAFLIATLGSGLGWIWVVLKYTLTPGKLLFPMDVYIAEGNSFLCVMAYPHFAEAAGLILAVLLLLLIGERRRELRYAVLAGFTAHVLGWQHAYDLLIVWGIPSVYAGVRLLVDQRWPGYWFKAILITIVLSWPPALYSVLLTQLSPIWKEVLAQFSNAGVYTPDLFHLLILMGIPLITAILTLIVLVIKYARNQPTKPSAAHGSLFVGVWFLAGWALAYVPTDFQIHMLNSWQIPVAFLATIGLYDWIIPVLTRRWSTRQLHAVVAVAFLALISLTNVYLWSWRFLDLGRHDYPYFLHRDEMAALEWLEEHTPSDAIVLSSYDVGRYVPGLSGRPAFLAHWAQTVGFYDKQDRVARFFDARVDEAERLETLQTFDVGYVFYGPAEGALGAYDPSSCPQCSVAFSSPQVTVFRVNTDQISRSTLGAKSGERELFARSAEITGLNK
jgi:hypothetical protein